MTDKEVLQKKQSGDIITIAQMLGVTKDNADRIIRRPNAKLHKKAITALRLIVETREALINDSKTFSK
jgi:hypothetical protein